jgi:hypothetical protein
VRTIFDYWFDGDRSKNYRPYRKLEGYSLAARKSKVARCKASKVINTMLQYGGVTESEVAAMKNYAERDRLFDHCYYRMFRALYPSVDDTAFDRRRIGDLTYTHVYDLLHPRVKPRPKKRRRTGEAAADAI